jgi:hypothetical protein
MVRDIKIHPVLNGFIVEVGCQTVVFDSLVKLNRAIHDYFTDPEGTEKKFIDEAVNNMRGLQQVPHSTGGRSVASSGLVRQYLNEIAETCPGNSGGAR